MFETENMFAALLQQCKGVAAMKAWLNQDNMLHPHSRTHSYGGTWPKVVKKALVFLVFQTV